MGAALKIGLLSVAHYSLGHLGIARALAHEFQTGGHDAIVYTDQSELARTTGFMLGTLPVKSLWEELSSGFVGDIVVLDTIPFRRQELVFPLLSARSGKRQRYLCGHTGWLPYYDDALVQRWRDLLSMLSIKTILLYHGIEVCGGDCHIASLAFALGVNVVHAGLLLPSLSERAVRGSRILVSAGGGAGMKGMLPAVLAVVEANPELELDITVGPYAGDVGDIVHPRLRIIPFTSDMARLLSTYAGSITRVGYGACVDHIWAGTPALLLPLPNGEQRANAAWVQPWLSGSLSFDQFGKAQIAPAQPNWPKKFDPSAIEACRW